MKNEMKKIGLREPKDKRMLIEAVGILEKYTGQGIDVIVPGEIGGANTPIPLAAATNLHKIAVDGDYAGRSIPESKQINPYAHAQDDSIRKLLRSGSQSAQSHLVSSLAASTASGANEAISVGVIAFT